MTEILRPPKDHALVLSSPMFHLDGERRSTTSGGGRNESLAEFDLFIQVPDKVKPKNHRAR